MELRKVCGTMQLRPAEPEMRYSTTTGRCYCGDTITLRADGFWVHPRGLGGRVGGTYCRNSDN